MSGLNRDPPNSGGYYVESNQCASPCNQQVKSFTAHFRCLRIIEPNVQQHIWCTQMSSTKGGLASAVHWTLPERAYANLRAGSSFSLPSLLDA